MRARESKRVKNKEGKGVFMASFGKEEDEVGGGGLACGNPYLLKDRQ